jgi:tetratricopeptide (TPR) repeat protein
MDTPAQLSQEGKKLYAAGKFTQAGHTFGQAAEGYLAANDQIAWAEARNNQSVALLQDGNPAGALASLEGTHAAFETAGDKLRLAMSWGNRASALDALDRLDEAEQEYLRASELLKELSQHDLRAELQKGLSAMLMRSGRQMEALATMKVGVDGLENPGIKGSLLKKLLELPFKWFK